MAHVATGSAPGAQAKRGRRGSAERLQREVVPSLYLAAAAALLRVILEVEVVLRQLVLLREHDVCRAGAQGEERETARSVLAAAGCRGTASASGAAPWSRRTIVGEAVRLPGSVEEVHEALKAGHCAKVAVRHARRRSKRAARPAAAREEEEGGG